MRSHYKTIFSRDAKNAIAAKGYILIALAAFCLFIPCTTLATEKDLPDESAPPMDTANEKEADTFVYVLEGRPDPFLPFIQPKVATTLDPNEIIEGEVELTGMQLFEPGQLTLVAVMETGGTKVAMVEDVTGKGYVLRQGVLIGRNGIVSAITEENDVIITETARTRAGKEIITEVVMRLNKEGDQ